MEPICNTLSDLPLLSTPSPFQPSYGGNKSSVLIVKVLDIKLKIALLPRLMCQLSQLQCLTTKILETKEFEKTKLDESQS